MPKKTPPRKHRPGRRLIPITAADALGFACSRMLDEIAEERKQASRERRQECRAFLLRNAAEDFLGEYGGDIPDWLRPAAARLYTAIANATPDKSAKQGRRRWTVSAEEVIKTIQARLTRQEWNADTVQAIADDLRAAGYKIEEPRT